MEELITLTQLAILFAALTTGLLLTVQSIYSVLIRKNSSSYEKVISDTFIVFVYLLLIVNFIVFFSSKHTYDQSFMAMEQLGFLIVVVIAAHIARRIKTQTDARFVNFLMRTIFYGAGTSLLFMIFSNHN